MSFNAPILKINSLTIHPVFTAKTENYTLASYITKSKIACLNTRIKSHEEEIENLQEDLNKYQKYLKEDKDLIAQLEA